MGQPIKVRRIDGADHDVRQFVLDRNLGGMGLREYSSPDEAISDKPDDLAARRLFSLKGVATVFVYGSTVTVTKAPSYSWDELAPQAEGVLRNLFVHYDINRG